MSVVLGGSLVHPVGGIVSKRSKRSRKSGHKWRFDLDLGNELKFLPTCQVQLLLRAHIGATPIPTLKVSVCVAVAQKPRPGL